MGRVTVTEIQKGDSLTSSGVNSTISSWQAESSSIDNENVRDGGLDRRNFKKHHSVYNIPTSMANDNVLEIPSPNSTPSLVGWGAFPIITYVEGEQIMLRTTFEYDFYNLLSVPSHHRASTQWKFLFQYFLLNPNSLIPQNQLVSLDCNGTISIAGQHFRYGPQSGPDEGMIHGSSGLSHLFRADDLQVTQPVDGDLIQFHFAACAYAITPTHFKSANVRLTSLNQHMQRFNR
tara:strand:- start:770 stop:1468 length:699 start_codon:yes stop_codon:yes gene_type:complete